ncbi:MAG TPA: ATP-binding protein [Verrucomicrobiae bacterium]|nr:ATP-binding protein [Verrucomicrobiae bacterium]
METILPPPPPINPPAKSSATRGLRALIADDSENDAIILLRGLRNAGFEVEFERVWNATAMKAALKARTWDIVISDYEMPGFGGFEALQVLQASGLDLPFILVSAVVSEETAVMAMKAGAHDYIMKRKLARLVPAIERELREAQTRLAHKAAEAALQQKEEHLRHTQKMEALGLLAASVAHDFNNILTAISGHSELLLGGLVSGDSRRVSAEQIGKCAQMAAGLTKQLLTFSRKQVIAARQFDLNEIVRGIEIILRRFTGRQIDFRLGLSSEPANILADSGQIEQILVNLVVNARDAMPDGGKLLIMTENIILDQNQIKEFPGFDAGDYVTMAIADTGTGMTAEVKARLFEPFFTTKPHGKGTGLGLATCFGIVRQSNAQIKVHSELGKGTAFKIYFPKAKPASSP